MTTRKDYNDWKTKKELGKGTFGPYPNTHARKQLQLWGDCYDRVTTGGLTIMDGLLTDG